MKRNFKKTLLFVIISTILVISIVPINVAATDTHQVVIDGVAVVFDWNYGKTFTSEHSLLTSSASTDNSGYTIEIKLMQYVTTVGYMEVAGSYRTIVCDGNTHPIYDHFSIKKGNTYRLCYRIKNGNTSTFANINVANVIWDY